MDDDDEVRLSKVVTFAAPPPPLDILRLGIQLPEKFQERARWRVGTIVDCNLSVKRRRTAAGPFLFVRFAHLVAVASL